MPCLFYFELLRLSKFFKKALAFFLGGIGEGGILKEFVSFEVRWKNIEFFIV